MAQTISEIEAGMAQTRNALGGAIDELEDKMKSAADWTTHFRSSPELWMAGALGLGLLAGSMIGRRTPGRQNGHPPSPSPRTSDAWDKAKSDFLATGTSMALDFIRSNFPRRDS